LKSCKIIFGNKPIVFDFIELNEYFRADYLPEKSLFSKREMEVLHWLLLGKTIPMIAQILEIKPRTIKAHIANAKKKANCQTLFQIGYYYAKIQRGR
jgi:DNA-binding CsgD family transcriptional regulator